MHTLFCVRVAIYYVVTDEDLIVNLEASSDMLSIYFLLTFQRVLSLLSLAVILSVPLEIA